jgi:hypothetical protein
MSGGLCAQIEGPGPKPTIAGRRLLAGTLTPALPSKTFSATLTPGLYRLTYLSASAPAVLQVSVDGVLVGSAAHFQPFATVMRLVNGQLKGTVDLAPTGLCSSDVAGDGDCAGQKLHFRLMRQSVVSVKVTGRPAKAASFQLLLDPLQTAPVPVELSVNNVFNAYLAFGESAPTAPPLASYRLRMAAGQRVGILIGSPDFTSTVEARSLSGTLIAANSGFNELLDPCREVRIDRLPKFDPYSQTDSYIAIEALEETTYTINVRPRFAGESGLFILRTFDITDPKIEPKQMRLGYLGQGPNEFVVSIPAGWQSGGSRIAGYSSVPISVVLKDASGRTLATSVNQPRDPVQPGVQTSQLSLMQATAIDLDSIEPAALAGARIEVKTVYDTPGQFFLIGFAAEWGSCGGGAVDPVAVIYPMPSDFSDRGYPLAAPQKPLAVFEAIMYDVARSDLKWNLLLQAAGNDQKDPADLISNYVRLVPDQASISSLLVDYQVAVRAQFSPTTGATRLWTRVERRGFKEKDWHVDVAETAKAQQRFVDRLRDHLSAPK